MVHSAYWLTNDYYLTLGGTNERNIHLKAAVIAAACSVTLGASAFAANTVLKIGFVGVTIGPAAARGISNQRLIEAGAAIINDNGGVKIGDVSLDIEIESFDDQKDPKRAIAGMEKMAQ